MRSIIFVVCWALCFGLLSSFEITPEMIGRQVKAATNISSYDDMTTPQIIESFGYKAETHHVVTEDGYILAVHRIPYGITGPSEGKRPIAFLQHCLLCSSTDWVMNKPDRALAYLLADAGYDVWMNNVRGNTYSRNHTSLDPDKDKKKFWQFTWDEMSNYDVPAAIDYALEATGNTDLYFVGFSMGTTNFFAMMNDKPEYGQKIRVAALMAPIAYVEHIKGPLRLYGPFSGTLNFFRGLTRRYEYLPSGPILDYCAQNFCAEEDRFSPICYNMLSLMGGFDKEELNKEYLPAILSHTPAGTSVHTVDHYGQLIHNGLFQKYDLGRRGNKKKYGQKKPPQYDLGVDTPPLGLFSGANDWLADPQDVAKTTSELKNVVFNKVIGDDKWSHLDFVWAIHAKEYVYTYLMDFLAQY